MKGLLTPLGFIRYGKAKRFRPWTQRYMLTHILAYKTKRDLTIVVPKGFITNFATWVKPRGLYEVAAALHDYLYSKDGVESYGLTRHEADKVFRECMRRAGCSQARINMMYYGVRLFGWAAYNK